MVRKFPLLSLAQSSTLPNFLLASNKNSSGISEFIPWKEPWQSAFKNSIDHRQLVENQYMHIEFFGTVAPQSGGGFN